MNTTSRAILLTSIFTASLTAQPVTRFPAEWHVPSTTSTKRFMLVDQLSGAVRIANLDGDANVQWLPAVQTGIPNVSDVSAGLGTSSNEILAVTSPEANRVMLVDLDAPSPYPRVLPTLTGIGPSGVAALGSLAAPELGIVSAFNGAAAGLIESRNNLTTTANLTGQRTNLSLRFRRLQPLVQPGGTAALGVFSETSGSNTRMGLLSRNSASHDFSVKFTFTGTVEFATQISSLKQPMVPFVFGYRPGLPTGQLISLATPLTTASAAVSNLVAFPSAVSSVMPVLEGGAGPINEGFIGFASDGLSARWYRINADGNGIEDAGQVFTPEPGQFLSGLVIAPGIGLVKLNSATLGGRTTSWQSFNWNGSDWEPVDGGLLEEIPDSATAPATLLFYNLDPALDESARLLGLRNVGSWTRRTSGVAVPATILTENFLSSTGGLTSSGNLSVSPAPGTSYVVANQPEPGLSLSSLGGVNTVFSPSLSIEPPSGEYDRTLQVTALFDDERFRLWVRRDGGNWQTFGGSIPVAWTTSLQFTLESRTTGTRGPIQSRDYTLDVASLRDIDSDNDGVPDYVEIHFSLDPFGGADSDGDGVSDLEEILHGFNPADPLNYPRLTDRANAEGIDSDGDGFSDLDERLAGTDPSKPADFPEDRYDIAPGGGVRIVAISRDHSNFEILTGQDMEARAIDGSLIARAEVRALNPELPDGTKIGAVLRSSDAVPADQLLSLYSPLYFNVDGTGARSGREMVRMLAADPPGAFNPEFTPTGLNLGANATAWVTAARTSAASQPLAREVTTVSPVHSAVAVLTEHLVHSALLAARPLANPTLKLEDFSLFAGRDSDRTLTKLTTEDMALLKGEGFDFRSALELAETARNNMNSLAIGIYLLHSQNSASTPDLMLPIDALRFALRNGVFPDGYSGAATAGILASSRNSYDAVVNQVSQSYRPLQTWTVEIMGAAPRPGVYQRVGDSIGLVAFRHAGGDRFFLEQGFGLRAGTRLTLTGFTDTPPDGVYPTMEVTAASLTFQPTSSDKDIDGNLLEDEWEKFFFGDTGQNPLSEPNGNGYTLMQYFLSGTDPRGGTLPDGPPLDLAPQNVAMTKAGAGSYHLDFRFPAEYQGTFDFHLQRSLTLLPDSFQRVEGAVSISSIGGDTMRAIIPAGAAPPGKAFYRIEVELK